MRVSIITPTIDSANFIGEAVESVPHNEGVEIEHIVVHDGSEAYVARLAERYPFLKIARGPAEGATAAAARGVELATGDFILHLNSDDRLVPGALARLRDYSAKRPDVRIWTGGQRIFRTLADGAEVTLRQLTSRSTTDMSLKNLLDDLPLLMARFLHRSVYDQVGNMDSNFSECSDRELLLRVAVAGIKDAPLGTIVSEMRWHEGSRTIRSSSGWIPPYLLEHLRIADRVLARTGISKTTRRTLRNWRAREVLRLAAFQFKAGQRCAAFHTGLSACAEDFLWPARSLTAIGARQRRQRTE